MSAGATRPPCGVREGGERESIGVVSRCAAGRPNGAMRTPGGRGGGGDPDRGGILGMPA